MKKLKAVLFTLMDIGLLALSTIGFGFIRDCTWWFVIPDAWPNAVFVPVGIVLPALCLTLVLALSKRYTLPKSKIIAVFVIAVLASAVFLLYQRIMTGELMFGCDTQFLNMVIMYAIIRVFVKAEQAEKP